MKSKATGCGSISTVFSSLVLLCISLRIIVIIILMIIIIIIIIIMVVGNRSGTIRDKEKNFGSKR